jgi:predicted phage terminase large subunit-like protein
MNNSQVSPAEAASELLKRRRARNSFLAFVQYTFPKYVAEGTHIVIADHLEMILDGDIARLMVFAPPQHGKSTLTSVYFPAYALARQPSNPVILTSYGASLAHKKSGEARAVVESPLFANLFPDIKTDNTSRSKENWKLEGYRGEMIAAGVGGPITGHGSKIGAVDDPVENWEQAQSKTYRDRAWDWFRTTFRTRIWEHGAIVIIMTRWHVDDLAGRLLQDQGDRWTVLRLPALAETQEERDFNNKRMGLPEGQPDPLFRKPGEPLCPKRFSKATLLEIKRDVGANAWSAEYQGSPVVAEGNRFKRHWFKLVDIVPTNARRVRYWDKAGSVGRGAYTAGILIAQHNETYFVEDAIRGQWSSHDRENIIKQTAELDRQNFGRVDIWIEQEPGSGGKESAENTIRNLAGFSIRADKVTGSKDTRLEPFAAQVEGDNVRLKKDRWNWDYIEELCAVPNGAFRDQADASAGAFNKLVSVGRAKVISVDMMRR